MLPCAFSVKSSNDFTQCFVLFAGYGIWLWVSCPSFYSSCSRFDLSKCLLIPSPLQPTPTPTPQCTTVFSVKRLSLLSTLLLPLLPFLSCLQVLKQAINIPSSLLCPPHCVCLSLWILSRRYLSSHWTVLTKLGIVVYYHETECQEKKNWFAIFKVKVTVKA